MVSSKVNAFLNKNKAPCIARRLTYSRNTHSWRCSRRVVGDITLEGGRRRQGTMNRDWIRNSIPMESNTVSNITREAVVSNFGLHGTEEIGSSSLLIEDWFTLALGNSIAISDWWYTATRSVMQVSTTKQVRYKNHFAIRCRSTISQNFHFSFEKAQCTIYSYCQHKYLVVYKQYHSFFRWKI